MIDIKYNFDKNILESLGVSVDYFDIYQDKNRILSPYKIPFMLEMHSKYGELSSYKFYNKPKETQKDLEFTLNISTCYFTDIFNTIKGYPINITNNFQSIVKTLFLRQVKTMNYDFSFKEDFSFNEPEEKYKSTLREHYNVLDLLNDISFYYFNIKSNNQDNFSKEFVQNIMNNILFSIIDKLNDFFTWVIIYNNLPIYEHLGYTDFKDVELSDKFPSSITKYRKIVLKNLYNKIAYQLFEKDSNINLNICNNISILRNFHTINHESLKIPNNFFVILINIITEVSLDFDVKINVRFYDKDVCLADKLYTQYGIEQIDKYEKYTKLQLE